MLWSPCIISISATMATLFLSPLGNDRDGQRITLTAHWMDHSAYLIIELLLWRSHIFMSISIWRDLATSVLPKYLSYQFSSHILFKSLTIQPNNCIQPVNQCIITSGNFSLQEKCMTMCAAQSFFHCEEKKSLHPCPSGLPQKGVVMIYLSASGWCLHVCRTNLKIKF